MGGTSRLTLCAAMIMSSGHHVFRSQTFSDDCCDLQNTNSPSYINAARQSTVHQRSSMILREYIFTNLMHACKQGAACSRLTNQSSRTRPNPTHTGLCNLRTVEAYRNPTVCDCSRGGGCSKQPHAVDENVGRYVVHAMSIRPQPQPADSRNQKQQRPTRRHTM